MGFMGMGFVVQVRRLGEMIIRGKILSGILTAVRRDNGTYLKDFGSGNTTRFF